MSNVVEEIAVDQVKDAGISIIKEYACGTQYFANDIVCAGLYVIPIVAIIIFVFTWLKGR